MNWRKSTRCDSSSDCIAAGSWRKSTYSAMAGGDGCVGAGTGPYRVGVKDTTLGEDSPVLEFSQGAWRSLIVMLKSV